MYTILSRLNRLRARWQESYYLYSDKAIGRRIRHAVSGFLPDKGTLAGLMHYDGMTLDALAAFCGRTRRFLERDQTLRKRLALEQLRTRRRMRIEIEIDGNIRLHGNIVREAPLRAGPDPDKIRSMTEQEKRTLIRKIIRDENFRWDGMDENDLEEYSPASRK